MRKLLEHSPASLLVHPQDVNLLVLNEAEVSLGGLVGHVAVVVDFVAAVEVVVEAVDVVVLVDVDDRLGLKLADPCHRRLFRQLRTLVTLLTRVQARAFVATEAVVT